MSPDSDRLEFRRLSSFPRVTDPGALLTASTDCLYVDPAPCPDHGKANAMIDTGPQAYVLSLLGACFLPGNRLLPPVAPPVADARRIRGLRPGGKHLLLTAANEVIGDSLTRTFQVHSAIRPDADGFRVRLPEQVPMLEGATLFAELITTHFGHALVDATARLWPLNDPAFEALRDLTIAALPLSGDLRQGAPQHWPGFLSQLLQGCGAVPDRVLMLNGPIRFERLLIPRRISPLRTGLGPRYLAMMRAAGGRIAPRGTAVRGGDRVFLSRSRLKGGERSSDGVTEARLDALFARFGYDVVHPQTMPFAEQIALVRQACHVAGCIGSQLHLLAFHDGSPPPTLLRLRPSYLDIGIDAEIVAGLGGHLVDFVVERAQVPGVPNFQQPWTLEDGDFDRLERLLAQNPQLA